jgi:hypothetical protein
MLPYSCNQSDPTGTIRKGGKSGTDLDLSSVPAYQISRVRQNCHDRLQSIGSSLPTPTSIFERT